MEDLIRQYNTIRQMSAGEILVSSVDILLVSYLIYRLLLLVRGTRTWRIIMGIIGFLLILGLSAKLHLNTLHYILDRATPLGPVALVILFLPEMRQALEGFGKLGSFTNRLGGIEEIAEARTVEELVAAMAELASQSIGALVVIQRTSSLDEIASNGVALNARVSAPLLGAIFYEGNPLHDGAVIIKGDTIVAGACRLPLSESQRLDQNVHMRHRAAVGVTESLDCLVVVVSEERGTISVAMDGRLRRLNSHIELREILNSQLRQQNDGKRLNGKDASKSSRRTIKLR